MSRTRRGIDSGEVTSEVLQEGSMIVEVNWVKGEVRLNLVRVERSSTLQGVTYAKFFVLVQSTFGQG